MIWVRRRREWRIRERREEVEKVWWSRDLRTIFAVVGVRGGEGFGEGVVEAEQEGVL